MLRSFSTAALGLSFSMMTSSLAYAETQFTFNPLAIPTAEHITLIIDGDGELETTAKSVDNALNGALSKAIESAEFTGDFGKSLTLYGMGAFKSITLVGSGDETLSIPKLRDLGGYIAKATLNDKSVSVIVEDIPTNIGAISAELATGFALRDYSFDRYKSDSKDIDRTVSFIGNDAASSETLYTNDLMHLVKGVAFARDMGSEPGKNMYPEQFAQDVKTLFRNVPGTRFQSMELRDLQRNNMGALIGVGQGSVHDPRLVIVTYNGASSDVAPIALVGKGITFDTGGISLKPNSGQWLMKSDLSGAAAVAGAVYAAAKREEKINLVGVMSMAENMPASDAIRPGDVLETMSGKTIEVMSTDAEGRLVLADAVTYTQENYDPSLLLNIATLTGSAGRALGEDYAALITRDWDLSEEMMAIGKTVGEHVWPLPLHKNHFKAIRSDIADIKSTAGSPGASIGGAVIGTFIDEDQPWVHLDIAGVDWLNSDTPTAPKGHAGWGVRFMDGVVRDRAAE
jgi:leucyl aminopeptidase